MIDSNLDNPLISHPYGHHKLISGLLILQQELYNVHLIMFNSISIAGTQGCEEFDQLFVFVLYFAQIDELFDDTRGDLGLQKLLIVTQELFNSALSKNIILFIGLHCLREEEIDPLRCVHLVYFVATDCTLQQDIGVLAETSDQIFLSETVQFKGTGGKGEVQDLNYVFYQIVLSHNFLSLSHFVLQRIHIEISSS